MPKCVEPVLSDVTAAVMNKVRQAVPLPNGRGSLVSPESFMLLPNCTVSDSELASIFSLLVFFSFYLKIVFDKSA